jgi:hypothetical protein
MMFKFGPIAIGPNHRLRGLFMTKNTKMIVSIILIVLALFVLWGRVAKYFVDEPLGPADQVPIPGLVPGTQDNSVPPEGAQNSNLPTGAPGNPPIPTPQSTPEP